jgi:methylenetetrahydrofolate reductase (NADPH)
MKNKEVGISFEVFPPKTEEGFSSLGSVCQQLKQLNPKYISVTFGAGGSTQTKTQAVVRHLVNNQIPSTPHITCIGMTRERISQLLDDYRQLGIERLVVIQGDLPANHQQMQHDFNYAAELVEYIRKTTGDHFHISVAAYPEFHPRAENPLVDLDNFKRKIDAGANSAITQFFYNSDAYMRFVESCDKIGIHIPIIPGIMPIDNYQKLNRFAATCGAEIPLWLRKRLETHVDDPKSMREVGVEIVTKLCERLLAEGVQGMHFYTLNQLEPTTIILKYLC